MSEVHESASVSPAVDPSSSDQQATTTQPTLAEMQPSDQEPSAQSDALSEMLTIALPSVATMSSYTIMQFVDKLMVKEIGPEPVYVSAQSNGGMMAWMLMSFVLGLSGVINSFVSQNMGAGKPERGAAYAWNGLWIASAYWVLFLVPAAFFAPQLFRSLHEGQDQLITLEIQYAKIILLGGIGTLLARSIHHFFYGIHRPKVVLVSAVCGNITNIFLNWVLIFGNLGAPELGLMGAGIATITGSCVEFAIPLALFLSAKFAEEFQTRQAWRITEQCIKGILKALWAHAGKVRVYAEIQIGIHHMFLSDADPKHIRRIHSKPEVFAQCRSWLSAQYPNATLCPDVSTSQAVQTALEENATARTIGADPGSAAIASELAGELYGLPCLYEGIEDNEDNITRFYVISKERAGRTGDDKTAITFVTEDKHGALVEVLQSFHNAGVNLSHIDKRPSGRENWNYTFYVDAMGHRDDPSMKRALKDARVHCKELHVLGSFPRSSRIL